VIGGASIAAVVGGVPKSDIQMEDLTNQNSKKQHGQET
jgi:hypothetical protein